MWFRLRDGAFRGGHCKCEMSSTHISQEYKHAILVVKCQFMSYTFIYTTVE